jgi:hypothetical protein
VEGTVPANLLKKENKLAVLYNKVGIDQLKKSSF